MAKVYFRKVTSLEEDAKELLELLSWGEIINKNDSVLIKPNFCTHSLKNGVTTNLQLLKSVIEIVKMRTNNVFVGETYSAGKNFQRLRQNFNLDCDFVNLSKVETCQFRCPAGTFSLPKIALESKIVNLPVLKTHVLTGVTLGIKNLFGLVQDRNKTRYHHKIHRVLTELLSVLQPQINLLDATFSMDGEGPEEGRIHNTNFLLASRNVVALDAAACMLIGVNPLSIKHIKLASQKHDASYEITGSGVENLNLQFRIPELGVVRKIGAMLQSSPLIRNLVEEPHVYSIARKIKKVCSYFAGH